MTVRSVRRSSLAVAPAGSTAIDRDLFPPAFLRLLAAVPGLVRRLHAGVVAGTRPARGGGGPFLFRGHREYRPGDDLRRVDWAVLARLNRVVVREFDEERDSWSEVWFDGSASAAPFGGWPALARATAVACAVGLAYGGRTRLGVVREGEAEPLLESDDPAAVREALAALSAEAPAGRAGVAKALPRLRALVPRNARWTFLSDLLTRAEPGALRAFAGRGITGAIVHLRVPELTAPVPGGLWAARDVETGEVRTVRWTREAADRVTRRAAAHAALWASHAAQAGLEYVPFAPTTPGEDVLRRLALLGR